MKHFLIPSLIISMLLPVQFMSAQTADEIVDKYINALGGKEKLLTLKTAKFTGSMTASGNELKLTYTTSHLKGTRTDILLKDLVNYPVVTSTSGIMLMPVQGVLFNYKEKGTAVELIDTATINDELNYKLKLTFKNGIVTNYFIGSKNNRLNKTSGKRKIGDAAFEFQVAFSNYKQNADGFWFAYTTVSTQGKTDFEKIETNIPVDESIFK